MSPVDSQHQAMRGGVSVGVNSEHRLMWLLFARLVLSSVSLGVAIGLDALGRSLGPEARQGLTFYVPRSEGYRLSFDGESHDNFRINPPDEAGRLSLSIPWRRLEFPDL